MIAVIVSDHPNNMLVSEKLYNTTTRQFYMKSLMFIKNIYGEWRVASGGGITALPWRNVVKIFDKGCKEGDQRTTSIGKSISQSDNRAEWQS